MKVPASSNYENAKIETLLLDGGGGFFGGYSRSDGDRKEKDSIKRY
jgi:hypothetical protein